jgi:hypothetical protein
MEQYSNNPSNTGQSSPTLSTHQLDHFSEVLEIAYISPAPLRTAERSLDLCDAGNQRIRPCGIVTFLSLSLV